MDKINTGLDFTASELPPLHALVFLVGLIGQITRTYLGPSFERLKATFTEDADIPTVQYIGLIMTEINELVEMIETKHGKIMEEVEKSMPLLDKNLEKIDNYTLENSTRSGQQDR